MFNREFDYKGLISGSLVKAKSGMKHYTAKDLQEMNKIYRRNLVNSSTGYKSANLIATISRKGRTNVAVFNSVFHLGSNPPMLGLVLRTNTVPKAILEDIHQAGCFTVNHIQENMIEQAHKTAVQREEESSAFESTGLKAEFLDDFPAPYVMQFSIKLGCGFSNEYTIKENGSLLVVAAIEHIYFEPGIEMPDGWLRLEDAGSVVINGLDGYAMPRLLDRFRYARPGEEIRSFFTDPKL